MTVIPNAQAFTLPRKWGILCDQGWSVFPVEQGGKKPLGAWKAFQTERAPTDTVRTWASRQSNIGIATGAVSGLVVLDLDSDEAVQAAEQRGIPNTITARTAKGKHVYFKHPGGVIGNRAGVLPGWDIRGDGGYVVAPGSVHPSGAEYVWDNPPGFFELADMPEWLLALLTKPEPVKVAPTGTSAASGYGSAAMNGELSALRQAGEGQRNHQLNRSTFALAQLAAGGAIDAKQAQDLLRATAATTGLAGDEIEKTIESAWAAGWASPRTAPEPQAKPKRKAKHKPIDAVDPETGEVFSVDGEISEDAIALAFTRRFGQTLRFDHDVGSWFEWDGTRWKKDGLGRAFNYARTLGRILSRGEDGERSLCRASVAGGAERFARADPVHAVNASVWDNNPMLLGTPGGTVELRTGKTRAAVCDEYITKQTTITPEAGEPTRWLAFLNEALNGDSEAIRFLQQWCGYCLTGETREHALAFVFGPGGNGKSVFLNTITAIMGDYAVTAAMETFTASKSDRHSTELAMLHGARLVTASETEEGRAWAEARVKQMTGGDAITARFMRQDNFTFKPQFKLTIAGNHAPALRNVDDAMRRRFNIVPFVTKPTTPDCALEDKLRGEHGKILSWAIAGCLDWQANGLMRPSMVTDATADYFEDQDIFGQWIAERCETGPSKWELPTRLYNDWCAFARDAGEDPGTAISLSNTLKKRGFVKAKTNGLRVYRGLSVALNGAGHE